MPEQMKVSGPLQGITNFKEQLKDLAPLPPHHELERWMVATQVTN